MTNLQRTRELATAIAPLLPGDWRAVWEEPVIGAYLVSGDMQIFVSAQTGYGFKPGMVRLRPHVPQDPNVPVYPENKVKEIHVGEDRFPQDFAKEITRRILQAQDYAAKAARQAQRVRDYHESEAAAAVLAGKLAEILGETPRGTDIYAYPHGTWKASAGSVRLDISLPAELALEVAGVIMKGYEDHRRSYP